MTAPNPVRQGVSTSATVSGKDFSTQNRDLADAISSMVPFAKIAYSGYPTFPIALQVPQAPWAIIAVRIVPRQNTQAAAPQGGFCSFAYDAASGVASVSACNAFITSSGTLLANVIYDFNFLAVF
jgi:hypothetical protein